MMTETGSSKLSKARLGDATQLSPEVVKQLIQRVDREGVLVVDWHILGTPATDVVTGTIHVPIKEVGRVTQDLLDVAGTRLRIGRGFPYGIVRPDMFQLTFDVRGAAQ
jgi:hypothetical protein